MIYTLTLNPALDYTVFAEGLTVGAVNRAGGFSISYGGKGINVSAMLKNLNVSSVALGFIAGFTGNELEKLLLNEGINFDFIKLKSGITRINVKIREKSETDINVQGPCASPDELNLLYKKVNKLERGDWLVLSGSIPSGMPSDIYARLSEFAEKRGARVIIDAAGRALTDSLYTKPFLIKPNREELGDIFSKEISGISDAFFYAEKLKAEGAQNVMITLGGEGSALICENGERLYCSAADGAVLNTVGAGDSAVAGFIAGYAESGCYKNALKLSAAAGGATAFSNGIGNAKLVNRLIGSISVKEYMK